MVTFEIHFKPIPLSWKHVYLLKMQRIKPCFFRPYHFILIMLWAKTSCTETPTMIAIIKWCVYDFSSSYPGHPSPVHGRIYRVQWHGQPAGHTGAPVRTPTGIMDTLALLHPAPAPRLGLCRPSWAAGRTTGGSPTRQHPHDGSWTAASVAAFYHHIA